MDEITKHLKEALAAVNAEQALYARQLDELARKEAAIKSALNGHANGNGKPQSAGRSLSDFLMSTIKRRDATTAELADLARNAGIGFKDVRSVNAILQGLKHAGYITNSDGTWADAGK